MKFITVGLTASLLSFAAGQGTNTTAPVFGVPGGQCEGEGSACNLYVEASGSCVRQQQQLSWSEVQYQECICEQDTVRLLVACAQCVAEADGAEVEAKRLNIMVEESSFENISPSGPASSGNEASRTSSATAAPSSNGSESVTATGTAPPAETSVPDSGVNAIRVEFGLLAVVLIAIGVNAQPW
ncbi:hypothetical protein OIO90_000393 [Microbotryomycetes sp. JL221]|nr:hypothetical protein OIO90_000393 [Microbotryomycetes sp. JL221]